MQTYTVDIAGEPVTLPIVAINDKLAISAAKGAKSKAPSQAAE